MVPLFSLNCSSFRFANDIDVGVPPVLLTYACNRSAIFARNFQMARASSGHIGEGSSGGRTFLSHRLLMGPRRSLANLDRDISL